LVLPVPVLLLPVLLARKRKQVLVLVQVQVLAQVLVQVLAQVLVQVPVQVPIDKRIFRHQKQDCRAAAEVCDCHPYCIQARYCYLLWVGQDFLCLSAFCSVHLAYLQDSSPLVLVVVVLLVVGAGVGAGVGAAGPGRQQLGPNGLSGAGHKRRRHGTNEIRKATNGSSGERGRKDKNGETGDDKCR
jgi:hypothetical protein